MDVTIQYPWYRRAVSPFRLPEMHSGEPLSDWPLTWPFPWPLPWTRPSYLRWPTMSDGGHSEMRMDKDRFIINLDVKHFSPEELTVKISEDFITIHAKHEDRQDDHGFVAREFLRKYKLPAGVDPDDVTSSLSCDGVMTVSAPRTSTGPERTIPIAREDGAAPQKK